MKFNETLCYHCKDTDTWYTMKNKVLCYAYPNRERVFDWCEVDIEHCACENLNLFKVCEHFGITEKYVVKLLEELQRWRKYAKLCE